MPRRFKVRRRPGRAGLLIPCQQIAAAAAAAWLAHGLQKGCPAVCAAQPTWLNAGQGNCASTTTCLHPSTRTHGACMHACMHCSVPVHWLLGCGSLNPRFAPRRTVCTTPHRRRSERQACGSGVHGACGSDTARRQHASGCQGASHRLQRHRVSVAELLLCSCWQRLPYAGRQAGGQAGRQQAQAAYRAAAGTRVVAGDGCQSS